MRHPTEARELGARRGFRAFRQSIARLGLKVRAAPRGQSPDASPDPEMAKAGVSEDGQWSETKVGTPQGAVASPLLANVYLDYIFDLWVEAWRKKVARDVIVVRYADDRVPRAQRQCPVRCAFHLTFVETPSSAKILRDVPSSHGCGMSRSVASDEMFGYSFCDHAEPPYPQHVMSTSRTSLKTSRNEHILGGRFRRLTWVTAMRFLHTSRFLFTQSNSCAPSFWRLYAFSCPLFRSRTPRYS